MRHRAASEDIRNDEKEEVESVRLEKVYSTEAFRACEGALGVDTLIGFPIEYAAPQENLGTVYDIIVEEAEANELPKPQEKSRILEPLNKWLVCEQKIYIKNHSDRIIITDQDKLYRYLSKNLKYLSTKRNWIAPFGILTTIVVTTTTSTFKPVLGIEPDTWFAIFVIAGLITFLWFIWSFCKDLTSSEIEDVIEDIINELSMYKNQF
jgi:hypothetical protein